MSPREKKLLILLLVGGAVMLNFFAFSAYLTKRQEITESKQDAEQALILAEMMRGGGDATLEEMKWLEEHEPKPSESQDVQVALQAYSTVEATQAGLEITKQDPMPTNTSGVHFHRAAILIKVTGTEKALYQWLDRINVPDQLRAATRLVMEPNDADDSLINCEVTIEQWFVPAPSA